jgi:hypothetical protein
MIKTEDWIKAGDYVTVHFENDHIYGTVLGYSHEEVIIENTDRSSTNKYIYHVKNYNYIIKYIPKAT